MVLPIVLADTALNSKQGPMFSDFHRRSLPKRSYLDIVFTGEKHDDKIKLEFAQLRIREILITGDTLNGLHFFFGNSSSYGTFVETIDKLRLEGAETYMPVDNNLWFFHLQPEKVVNTEYGCFLCDDVIVVKPRVHWWMLAKEKCIKIWLAAWQIIVLYVCFIISILALRRQKNGS